MNWRQRLLGRRKLLIASTFGLIFFVFANWYRLPRPPFVMPAYEEATLKIVVVDENDERIANAMVTPHGLRTVQRPGDHHSWIERNHGPIKTYLTNEDGIAEVVFPKWVSRETAMLTSTVTVAVEHPDYCLEDGFDCQTPQKGTVTAVPRIHLHQGGQLSVKAYRQGSTQPLTEFRAIVSGHWYSRGWWAQGDAMLSPPFRTGEHVLRIVDSTDPVVLQFSDPVVFDAVAGKTEELELYLRPGISIRGELDAPKPVKQGYVVAHISDAAAGPTSTNSQYIAWNTWTPVSENGEFEFHSLPPASSIAMLAWCEGFVCQIPARSTIPLHMQATDPHRLPQFFLVKPEESFCRIAMEPCAKCEITVTDSSGRPVEGVQIGFAPNVSFRPRGSWWFGAIGRDENQRPPNPESTLGDVFRKQRWNLPEDSEPDPDRLDISYDATTDANGKAVVSNLPGRGILTPEVSHPELVAKGSANPPFSAEVKVDLKSGETCKLAVVVVPKPAITTNMLQPPSTKPGRTLMQVMVESLQDLFGW